MPQSLEHESKLPGWALRDDTYVNDYFNFGLTTFYLNSDSTNTDYANPSVFAPNGAPGSVAVGGANPSIQVPAGFGVQGLYAPGGPWYDPQAYFYDGNAQFPPDSAACPVGVSTAFAAAGQTSPCGYNAESIVSHNEPTASSLAQ